MALSTTFQKMCGKILTICMVAVVLLALLQVFDLLDEEFEAQQTAAGQELSIAAVHAPVGESSGR